MSRSASSGRLRNTWENVKDRQNKENDRFSYKAPSMAKRTGSVPLLGGVLPIRAAPPVHRQGEQHAVMDAESIARQQEEEEDRPVLIMMQKMAFSRALAKDKHRYQDLEDLTVESRRPPTLRTAAGEVLQGQLPSTSSRWLSARPRFGGVTDDKFIGTKANELSKWCSVDRIDRLKQERDLSNWPVRHIVKIDDDIDIQRMQGSHLRYFQVPAPLEKQYKKTTSFRFNGEYDEEDYDEEDYDYDDEEEEESEEQSQITPRTQFKLLDEKFQAHVAKLGMDAKKEVEDNMVRVEADWRAGVQRRDATLRLKR